MAKSASPGTQEVAFQLAQNWIRTNFDVYTQKSVMYEKVSWQCCPSVPPGPPPQGEVGKGQALPGPGQPS